jgi:hypothetical protein
MPEARMPEARIIDAANVVGSRPDGWWRDRPGAARRLIGRIAAAIESERLTGPVTVVLEGRARPAADGAAGPVGVVVASGSGDDTIVSVAAGAVGDGQRVTVVTSDRELTERVRRLGADTESPQRFLSRLQE